VLRKQPHVTLDEERHLYQVDGLFIPSVTTILGFDERSFYKDNGARERGTVVHKMYEDHDGGLDVGDFYGDEYLAFLPHYQSFLDDYRPQYTGKEIRIYHELGYCGTIDRAGIIDKDFIADFKTGSSVPGWAALQTAAYAMAYYEEPEKVQRFVIHIHPKKLKTYRLHQYSNPKDFTEWTAKCNRYHETMRKMEEGAA